MNKNSFLKGKSENRLSWMEHRFALFLVAITGIVGSIYIMTTIHSTSPEDQQESIQYTSRSKQHDSSLFKMDGIMRENELINFYIQHFNGDINYTIDFGNNECQSIKKESFSYRYKEAGIYEITLSIEYQKHVYLLQKKLISIDTVKDFESKS